METMSTSRRDMIKRALFGAGMIGLNSLATGLPISFLLDPRRALAQSESPYKPTFLILATSGYGDALNANCPGAYEDPTVTHPNPGGAVPDAFKPTALSLGDTTVTAAKMWSTLSATARAQTTFFHHATLTANHGDEMRVMKLMGALRRDQMLVSLISKTLQPLLSTVQSQPIPMGGENVQYEGHYQPRLSPLGLKLVMQTPSGVDLSLQKLRDKELDRLNAILKGSRSTTAQRAFLDQLALSQTQVRKLTDQIASELELLKSDDSDGQVIAAPLLVRMGVSPVVVIRLPFSGDNHTDTNWSTEISNHTTSIANMNTLFTKLEEYGVADKTTFALLNVFGRTLHSDEEGRSHNPTHNVAMITGPAIRGGVIGGINEESATGIDPTTGAPSTSGITLSDSLASLGKTLARACGIDESVIEDQITQGQCVKGALKVG